MNPKQTPPPPAAGMSLEDIYYILFRRKWVILGASLLGFIAAAVVFAMWHSTYESIAEIYVGYVVTAKPLEATGLDPSPIVREPATVILNSELRFLQSLDVAKTVAETEGPARILGSKSAGTNAAYVDAAAQMIEKHLRAEVFPNTQVLRISFSHHDRELVKPVLDQLITNYINRRFEIRHRTAESDSYLRTQTDLRKNTVKTMEEQLARVKSDVGVVDISEAMKSFTASEARFVEANYVSAAELDDAKAIAGVLSNLLANTAAGRFSGASTNGSVTNKLTPPTEAEKEAYFKARQRLADLETLGARLQTTLGYTTNNSQVKMNLLDIEDAQAKKKALEDANPALVVAAAAAADTRTASQDPATAYESAYNNQMARIAGIEARIARQNNELARLRNRGTNLVQLEVTIRDMERDLHLDEAELNQVQSAMNLSAISDQAGPNKDSSISIIEQPTPPLSEPKKLAMVVGAIAGGGVALGLALAFLLEMILDRSFKRPQEVAAKLGLPFFLSVPYSNGHGPLRRSKQDKDVKLLPAGAVAPNPGKPEIRALGPAHDGPVAPWDEQHALRPFHEALRDRLIAFFEAHSMTHKPKLVALTSCHRGAGVSTMASGLACSLSETGEGNVLLVNMNSEEGDAHRYYKGKLNLGLDDIFEKEPANRETALVRDNLYVVKESSQRDKLPAILPKRFSHLVSKMKSSDYDYIIFDMPPVTPTSITPRLARFMDMALLVVESEKTDRDVARQAAALLSESRTNLAVVMNKNRSYVPRRLLQEF